MISPRDLCTLAEAKGQIGSRLTATTTDDALIQRFIGRASGWLEEYLSRSLAFGSYTEKRNGTGRPEIVCRRYPILAVSAVWIGNCQLQPAPDGPSGFSLSGMGFILSGDRTVSLRDRDFPRGTQNVLIEYQAGYLTPGILALAGLPAWQPGNNYPQGAQLAPPGAGFAFRALNPGKSGPSAPTWPQQQSATVTDGQVNWIATDVYPGIVAGTEFLPEAIKVAACELVALQYRNKDRVGDTSMGIGPERVNYFMRAMHPMTQESLKPFRDVTPPYEIIP